MLKKIKANWSAAVDWARDFSREHALHEGHQYAHIAYFGAVAAEGHGVYAKIASALFVLSVLERYYSWRRA